ncbi:hypothetical protein PAMP_024266 [Pampus punctatissimus]
MLLVFGHWSCLARSHDPRKLHAHDTTDDHTLLWLLNHIRLGIPELIIQIRHHKHTRVYAFFVTATYENLLRGAEEMGLRKAVKPEFGGGTRSFSCEEDYIYENIESELCFFTSQERQSIIKYWLDNLRAKHGEVLHNINFLEGQPIIPELSARGVIQQVFPLHEQRILSQLMKSWVQAVCEKQPLDDICDYFGVKIAMYFAWLGFYTTSMLYPAVIGFVLWMLTESDQTSRDICCVVFALFNVVWATLFLERWKRRGAELAYKWGTLDTPAESLEEPRPQFRGVKRCSPITGCEEFYYPPWRRRVFRWLVSLPICILCLCFVFLVMLICFELQEFVMGIKEMPRLARFIPKIMLAITVTACDEVYRKIACWLNDMENYRLQSAYEKNLIIKMVLFQFVNSYLSLFYIGFYLKDMERLKEMLLVLSLLRSLQRQVRVNVLPSLFLKVQMLVVSVPWFFRTLLRSKMLATLLIMRQFLQNVKEVLQPYLYERHKLGELTLRAVWDLLLSVLLKYARLAAGKAQASPTDQAMPGPGLRGTRPGVGQADRREKKCLNGGCGVPDEEEGGERDEADSGRFSEGETEEESLIDCGLKLRKVSFIEKDTFQDYQEMFVQFGYVVLFSSAFPLAAMCALINNIIEIRSDAFKLCTGLQRPFGLRVESIGQWQTAMEAMGLIAIIVNCYLIGQCGQLQRLFPWLSPEMAIISIVILEHFAILLKYIIHVAIPDIPTWVREEMAKLDYQRREAFKKHERQAQQHYQQLQRRKREEEERQRQAEHMARRERERDDSKGDSSGDHHHDKSHGSKSRSGGGGGGGGSDKPKRPSSLLANNNVMKLKQIIPLQSKFSGGARSPQSPTSSEPKLPGFLSFKFLKSPENKKECAAASSAATTATNGTATASSSSSSSGSSSQERSQSPSKAFNPGKLFNFGKSEGGTCVNGAPLPRSGEGSSSQTSDRQTSRSDLNGVPDEIPSPGGEGSENGHSTDLDMAGPKV